MASLFGITAADIQRKLAPGEVDSNRAFVIGGGEMSEADCDAAIARAEAKVKANLDNKYRRMLDWIDGEVLDRHADGVQTVWQLSFYPVTSFKLFVNYPDDLAWQARSSVYQTTEGYTLDTATGELTFAQAPALGTVIYADYRHSGAGGRLLHLRDIVENLVAVEVARRYNYFRSGTDGFNKFLDWETQADKDLAKYRFRDIGIPEFDDIRLVNDDTDEGQFNIILNERHPLWCPRVTGEQA